jgi:hypothetical protein
LAVPWYVRHRRLLLVFIIAAILFVVGLVLHELGALPEPINGVYAWLHERLGGGMDEGHPARWAWRIRL